MERTGALAAKSLTAEAIRTLCGLDILDAHKLDHVEGVTTPDRLYPYRVVFLDRFSDSLCGELESAPEPGVLVIATSDYRRRIPQARIITDSPRKVFARVVWELFDYLGDVQTERVHPTAKVHLTARLSVGVTVGAGGEIGEGAYLCPNVVVGPNVRIGKGCIIKAGTVIGQPGFGVYRDANGDPYHLPHVGGVFIGDHVELGALNTVASGTIHPTVIEDMVKTDDHVHIAHNCHVGARTLVAACAEMSGSVVVGRDCWIGPNAAIRDGIEIGTGAFIAIASNVVHPVGAGETVLGNPARSVVNGGDRGRPRTRPGGTGRAR